MENKIKELEEKLLRKEQECEELKEKVKKYGEINEQETKDYAELKAENEELKKIINEAKNSNLDLKSFLVGEAVQNEYEQQLDQLKAENEELKKNLNEGCLQHLTLMTEQQVLLKTITEIKEIAEENIRIADLEGLNGVYRRGLAKQILQKISEVENDNK